MEVMRVFLCGPMTGIPEFNYPAFTDAALWLRGHGFEVMNPAENGDGDTTRAREWYVRAALLQLLDAEMVVTLADWQYSQGATTEIRVARELDIPVYSLEEVRRRL